MLASCLTTGGCLVNDDLILVGTCCRDFYRSLRKAALGAYLMLASRLTTGGCLVDYPCIVMVTGFIFHNCSSWTGSADESIVYFAFLQRIGSIICIYEISLAINEITFKILVGCLNAVIAILINLNLKQSSVVTSSKINGLFLTYRKYSCLFLWHCIVCLFLCFVGTSNTILNIKCFSVYWPVYICIDTWISDWTTSFTESNLWLRSIRICNLESCTVKYRLKESIASVSFVWFLDYFDICNGFRIVNTDRCVSCIMTAAYDFKVIGFAFIQFITIILVIVWNLFSCFIVNNYLNAIDIFCGSKI